jgi:hypothetical protein
MKLKLLLSVVLLSMLSTIVLAQDDDGWVSKTYNVGDFKQIDLEGGFKVNLIQGDECSIKVKTTNEDVFDNLGIENYNEKVRIELDMSFFEYRRVNLYITFKTLELLDIEGGVNLKTDGYLSLNDFDVKIEGGANIDLDMKAENVKVYGEGGFLFDLNGVANQLDVTIKGAGHVGASDLKTKVVRFSIAGFGTGSVYATRSLDAKIEGVGKIRFKGDPKVTQYIDGLGSVKPYQ